MKRMLTACKIYNEWPEHYFLHSASFFPPVVSFSISDGILNRKSLSVYAVG